MIAWHYWLLAGIVLAIAEVFAPGFVLICFGLGALLTSLFTYWFALGLEMQILTFGVATLIVFTGSRTLFHDILWPATGKEESTNVDALLGCTAVVVEAIPGGSHRGLVKVAGEEWSAVTTGSESLAAGQNVTIRGVDGNKLVVVAAAPASGVAS
jgi:membrane protein implicated in regulation of membrane protease activity